MKECPWCKTYKKASNCIQCFMMEKGRNEKLIQDITEIVNNTSYYRTQEVMLEYLKKARKEFENR